MTLRSILVRVVPITERRAGGWTGLATGIMAFGAVTLVEADAKAWLLQLSIALACVGTSAVRRPRPRATTARVEDGVVLIDGAVWQVAEASVARGEQGFSIALVREGSQGPKEPFFLEVEREQDARALFEAWGIPWAGGTVAITTRNERARSAQRIIGAIGALSLLLGALWELFFPALQHNDPTYVLGPLACLATFLSTILFLADKPLRKRIVLGTADAVAPAGAGLVPRHIQAHVANRVLPDTEDADREPASTPETAVRARILDMGDETTNAWLTRIDTLAGGSGGYRSSEPTQQELWDVVDDGHAPVRSRLAAARLLARSHRVGASAIRARIADVGPRLRVVIDEDVEAAAAELDAIGPLFRARERA